jgi:hypothetical protein
MNWNSLLPQLNAAGQTFLLLMKELLGILLKLLEFLVSAIQGVTKG